MTVQFEYIKMNAREFSEFKRHVASLSDALHLSTETRKLSKTSWVEEQRIETSSFVYVLKRTSVRFFNKTVQKEQIRYYFEVGHGIKKENNKFSN